MAHSLNNATKQQFKDRVAAFSTRGSRRGFVDIPLPIPQDQLNDVTEKFESLKKEQRTLLDKVEAFRKEFGLEQGTHLKNVLSDREWYGRVKRRTWTEERLKKYEDARLSSSRLEVVSKEISVLKKRLMLSAEPEDESLHRFSVNGQSVASEFKINKSIYIQALMFKIMVRKVLGAEFARDIEKMVNELGITHEADL